MNERINELKSQCIFRETRGTTAFNSYVVDRFDTEKFAQLIVRECALTAGLMEHEGRQGIGAQILDNFGVEE